MHYIPNREQKRKFIRSLQIKDGYAYIRAGAGIVHDSVPKTEFEETEHKAGSCLRAVRGN